MRRTFRSMSDFASSFAQCAAITGVLGAMFLASTAHADRVQLRHTIRLTHDQPEIRLQDIATLEGNEALRLGSLIIATRTDPNGIVEITVNDVHDRLDAAGVHWGLVNLSGARVVVRPSQTTRLAPPLAMQPLTIEGLSELPAEPPAGPVAVVASELVDQPTLRGVVADHLARHFSVEPARLRLTFRASDEPALDLDRRDLQFAIHNARSPRTEIVALDITVFRNKVEIAQHDITITPEVLVDTCEVARDVRRGETLTTEDVRTAPEWMSPLHASQLPRPAEVVGRLVERTMREGDTVRREFIRQPAIIARGELINIRCIVGDVVLTSKAIAREDGADGAIIEVNYPHHRDTFLARVSGPGEATVDLARQPTTDTVRTAQKDDRS
ncbi:MAG: flagellar basal body P-ring formation protein FlgA [Phycisphaerales bacterium]|nr:flagellar basal body P-ring formation protein FlgA [Phycisphaerales bacterium]